MWEGFAKNFRSVLAVIVVLGTIAFDYMLFFKEIPIANKELLFTAFGTLNTLAGAVVTYYFGSSKDKSDKDKADIEQTKVDSAK